MVVSDLHIHMIYHFVMDDESRENEGDLIMAADALTAKQGVGKKPELPGDRPGFGDFKKSTVNKPSSMPQSKADRERFRKEMDGMHEWYCTSTKPEVEASQVCIRWRMQLKTLSKEERAKLQAISRENAEKMRKAMAAEKEAAATKEVLALTKEELEEQKKEFEEGRQVVAERPQRQLEGLARLVPAHRKRRGLGVVAHRGAVSLRRSEQGRRLG